MKVFIMEIDTNLFLLINNSETNILSNDISVLFNQVDQMFTALNNLSHINTTLSTYGATESMLALLNADGSFASALGINIPKLTKANKSSVTASMEAATEEAKKGIVKRIIEWITKIIAKIKEFITGLFSRKKNLEETKKEFDALPKQKVSETLKNSDKTITSMISFNHLQRYLHYLEEIDKLLENKAKESPAYQSKLGKETNPDNIPDLNIISTEIPGYFAALNELNSEKKDGTISELGYTNIQDISRILNYLITITTRAKARLSSCETALALGQGIINAGASGGDALKAIKKDLANLKQIIDYTLRLISFSTVAERYVDKIINVLNIKKLG